MLGASRAFACTHYFLGDFEIARKSAIRGLHIWHSGDVKSHAQEVGPSAVACLCDKAQSEWHLGDACCQSTMVEAIALSKELHVHGIVEALYFAACLSHYGRNPSEVERLASDLIELSTRQNFAPWLARGIILRGWARSASGDTAQGISWIEDGIEVWQATGAMLCMPFFLALKAEVFYLVDRTSEALEAVKEAERLAETNRERWWCAELHRLRGVFLTAIGADETQIEASFCEAIGTAREQKSISLTTRAKATYADYRNRQKANASGGRGFRIPICS